jgi:hypothetical protein
MTRLVRFLNTNGATAVAFFMIAAWAAWRALA